MGDFNNDFVTGPTGRTPHQAPDEVARLEKKLRRESLRNHIIITLAFAVGVALFAWAVTR